MNRYAIPGNDLNALIANEFPEWTAKANVRTKVCRKLHAFDGGSPMWSQIKPRYMKLQYGKCAYCETQLEGGLRGPIAHDVEHFRPKNAVDAWPTEKIRKDRRIAYRFKTGAAWPQGYYLLAFRPANYLTACKVCNSVLKRAYFPIAGKRGPQTDDPNVLAAEKPFLIYPLGSSDDDPEQVLSFDGIFPRPSTRSGPKHRRAQVMIDFFELDTREGLLLERAQQLTALMSALIVLKSNAAPDDLAFALREIELRTAIGSPHGNCARSFLKLHDVNPSRARKTAEGFMEYRETHMRKTVAGSPTE